MEVIDWMKNMEAQARRNDAINGLADNCHMRKFSQMDQLNAYRTCLERYRSSSMRENVSYQTAQKLIMWLEHWRNWYCFSGMKGSSIVAEAPSGFRS